MKKFIILFISIILVDLFAPVFSGQSVSDETGINLQITGVCNFNGICEPELGENSISCPSDCPSAVPLPPAGFIDDLTPPDIYNLIIKNITLTSAVIEWEVNEYSLCQLSFGQTEEYEKENIVDSIYAIGKHSTSLFDLSPATNYHFKIKCRDMPGNSAETKDQEFKTLAPPDTTPPANVINFKSSSGDGQITLTWQNPPDLDFEAVKIMRSTDFYPSDPWSGVPVYNQKGTSFIDTNLINGVRYYYTAFSYDKSGNYSSGAITSNVPQKPLLPGEVPPVIPPPPEEIPPIVPPPPGIEKLTLEDFDFIQEDKKIPVVEGDKIIVKNGKPLTIPINYEKVPEVLKTIMVTLEKDEKSFSFLLRINKEKTAYQATVMPPEESGIYLLTLTVLDYKNQTLKRIKAQFEVEGPGFAPVLKIPWYKKLKIWCYIILFILIVGVCVITIRRLIKKLKAKPQKSTQIKNQN